MLLEFVHLELREYWTMVRYSVNLLYNLERGHKDFGMVPTYGLGQQSQTGAETGIDSKWKRSSKHVESGIYKLVKPVVQTLF